MWRSEQRYWASKKRVPESENLIVEIVQLSTEYGEGIHEQVKGKAEVCCHDIH